MTVRNYGWFPVTVERPGVAEVQIVNAAVYDNVQNEVGFDDDYQRRFRGVSRIVAESDTELRFIDDYEQPYIVRQSTALDGARWDRNPTGIDLPVEIIGAIMTSATGIPTVAAAVDDDGDVHTMVLETRIGLFARYARSWIRMGDISPIENLDIIEVVPSDLEIYDQADDAGQTTSLANLHPIDTPNVSAVDVTSDEGIVAAAPREAEHLVITSAADLPDAIAYASRPENEQNRWYVARRAKALGWDQDLPWEAT